MTAKSTRHLKDGAKSRVIGGVHEAKSFKAKSVIVRDIKIGKTGDVSITVVHPDREKVQTLAKNIAMEA